VLHQVPVEGRQEWPREPGARAWPAQPDGEGRLSQSVKALALSLLFSLSLSLSLSPSLSPSLLFSLSLVDGVGDDRPTDWRGPTSTSCSSVHSPMFMTANCLARMHLSRTRACSSAPTMAGRPSRCRGPLSYRARRCATPPWSKSSQCVYGPTMHTWPRSLSPSLPLSPRCSVARSWHSQLGPRRSTREPWVFPCPSRSPSSRAAQLSPLASLPRSSGLSLCSASVSCRLLGHACPLQMAARAK
jgi:hypothetical protein